MALPNIIQQINSKLPLSGGKITGCLFLNNPDYSYLCARTTNDNDVIVCGGSNMSSGSTLRVCGINRSTLGGTFILTATDGTNNKQLIGYPNGTLTWSGNDVITSAGGTFNGNLNFSTSAGVIRDVGGVDSENKPLYQLSLGFETHEKLGGYILLRRGDSTAYNQAGMCALCASSPDGTRKYLFCFPDGRLLWDSSKVLTEADKTTITQWGLPNYNGIISGIGSTYTAPYNGFVSFNKSGTGNCTVNGITVYLGGNDAYNEGNVILYLKKGDTIVFPHDSGTTCFVPLYHGG